ncbi:hypothetical protein PICMEDRAFT_73314 [Pichia membranifaciens NRRL Y-2026]|uniref:Transcriptional regulatory protein SDS3 n=1 Tax=Pichia membranifaciens NRRL Y-2026 TaxID=763406 RepID=A0A1E3NI57_9ASCO|nr:hypothetical protein PICMEDRAFT_73314 [Pichia membranifaciens NRRL Y-2026]ODQ45817.1 hypothetical protein PICMEDRAFT_73314 [Pichia membranifaciens NRRL Y-2026]
MQPQYNDRQQLETQIQMQQMQQMQMQQMQMQQMQLQFQQQAQQAQMQGPVQQPLQTQLPPPPQEQQAQVQAQAQVPVQLAGQQSPQQQQHLTKRARRRLQIQSKLAKMDQQFVADKDVHYRDSLIQLQYKLSSLHSGENAENMQKVRDLEEWRDAELLRLRLAEEYQVRFINESFKHEYEQTVENTKSIVEMVKTKLQEGLISKIKQLKEDKALIDIVTSSKSVGVHTSSRSRSSLNHDANGGYSTDGTGATATATANGNTSGFDTNSSFFFSGERRSRRKRHHESSVLHDSNLTNSNDDSYDSSTAAGSSTRKKNKGNGNASSATEDSNKILTENPVLNEFLYGSKSVARKDKVNMKHPSKGTQHCPPLKPEEINEDLSFLRNFRKGRTT